MDTHATDSSVTSEKVAALRREIEGLQSALRRARLIRLGILVAAVLVVVAISWITLSRVQAFTDEKNLQALTDTASARLEKDSDYYLRQLQLLTDKVGPVISEAFLEQAKKDMPRYLKAIEAEKKPLLENLEREFNRKLEKRYASLRPELESALVQELPQLKGTNQLEQLVANVDRAMARLRKKYYVDDFHNEVQGLFATWDQFPAAPVPGKGEASVEDQFVGALIDLLTYKLTHAQRTAALP
jgi:hypothetical protein